MTCNTMITVAAAKTSRVCAVSCTGATVAYTACLGPCLKGVSIGYTIGRAGCVAAFVTDLELCKQKYGN